MKVRWGKERPPLKSGLHMGTLLIRLPWLPENELQIQILGTVSCNSCLTPFMWLPSEEKVLEVPPSPSLDIAGKEMLYVFPSAVSGEGEGPIPPMLGVRVTHRMGLAQRCRTIPR